MWKFLVKQQKIEILEREILADKQIQYVHFKFVFDGDWKSFTRWCSSRSVTRLTTSFSALRVRSAISLRSFMWVR